MAIITPKPHVMSAYANQNLTWATVLAELVDNGFDAGATRVAIKFANHRLTVSDDGRGVRDVLAVVTIGHHDPTDSTSLGMHGVGAKDAWLWCGDEIDIDTIHAGKRTVFKLDQRKILVNQTGAWEVPDPQVSDTTEPSGTVIGVAVRSGKNGPSQDAFDQLQYLFTPALRRGLQITRATTRGKTVLEPLQLPALQDSVRASFDIDGKAVDIDIGIVPDGERMHKGPCWIQYGHRIINSSSFFAGQYSTRRIGGTITLGKGWKLTKNKDDFNEHRERLADAIFARVEHVLKTGESLCESMESNALKHELEAALNSSMNAAKREKRATGESSGTARPASTGRRRTNAAKTTDNPGSVTTSVGRRTGFTLDWCNEDESCLGRFDSSGSRVYLNLDHEFIKSAKATDNRPALMSACWVLISDFFATHDKQYRGKLSFDWEGFASGFSILAKQYQGVVNAKAQAG